MAAGLTKRVYDLLEKFKLEFPFRDEEQKEMVAVELAKRYDLFGDTVVNLKNGAAISEDEFVSHMHSVAKPYLKSLGTGKYIPKFADTRTEEIKQAHRNTVGEVVEAFLQHFGYKFKYEHLGDTKMRTYLKQMISRDFMFEGTDPDGEVKFRKHYQGMFSGLFDPSDVINHYATPFLDMDRTRATQADKRIEAYEYELKVNGFSHYKDIPRDQREKFNEAVDNRIEAKQKIYRTERLPVHEEREYEAEFARRTMFTLGLRDEKEATLQQQRIISLNKTEAMERLNSLPDIQAEIFQDMRGFQRPVKSWGFDTINTGTPLPADAL